MKIQKPNRPTKNHPWRRSNVAGHRRIKMKHDEHPMKNWMHEKTASDEPTTDIHVTDPARLEKKMKDEIKKDLGVKDSPEIISNPRPKPNPISGIQDSSDHYMEKKND